MQSKPKHYYYWQENQQILNLKHQQFSCYKQTFQEKKQLEDQFEMNQIIIQKNYQVSVDKYYQQKIKQNIDAAKSLIQKILNKNSWTSKVLIKQQLNNITIILCLLCKNVNSFLIQLLKLSKAKDKNIKEESDKFNKYCEKLIQIAMAGLQIIKENYRQKGEQYLKLFLDIQRQILQIKELQNQFQSLSTKSEKKQNIINLLIRLKELIERQFLNILNIIIFQKNELENNLNQDQIRMKIKSFLQEFQEMNNLIQSLMDFHRRILEQSNIENLKTSNLASRQIHLNFKEIKEKNKQLFGSLFGQDFCDKTKKMLKILKQKQELKYQKIWEQVIEQMIKKKEYEIEDYDQSNSRKNPQIIQQTFEELNWDQQRENNQKNQRIMREAIELQSENETINDGSYQKQIGSLSSINDNAISQMNQKNFIKNNGINSEYGEEIKHQKNKKAASVVSVISQLQQEEDEKQTTEKIIFQRKSKDCTIGRQGDLNKTYYFKLQQILLQKFKGVEIKNQEVKKQQKFRLLLEEERVDHQDMKLIIIQRSINLKKDKKLQVKKITLNAKDLKLIFKDMKQNVQEIRINECKIMCQDRQQMIELQRQMNNLQKLRIINLEEIKWICKKQTKQINWEIKLEGLENLIQNILRETKIERLELKSLPKLQKLDLSKCQQLLEINLKGFDSLTKLNLSYTKIKKLELKSLPKLQKLNLSGCQWLSEINLNGFDNLTELILIDTKIKKLELKSLPKLQKLDLSWCQQLPKMIGDGFDNLTELILMKTKIKKLELKSLPKLQKLDLTGCQQLSEANLNGFDNLEVISNGLKIQKLKTGAQVSINMGISY